MGTRQRGLMAAAAKTRARLQELRARGVLRVGDRLIDPATANQPAAHDRLAFVVGRPVDAARRPPRIVEHVERARSCALAPSLRRAIADAAQVPVRPLSRRSASRAWPTASCSITAVAPGASSSGHRPAGGGGASRARKRRHQGTRHALGLAGLEPRRQRPEAAPRHLHVEAVEDLALARRHPARPHHLQIATMPARGQTKREGDVMPADGALELGGEGAQRRDRDRRRRPYRKLRLDHRRRLGARHLAQGARQVGRR